jgi:UPF0176 protein
MAVDFTPDAAVIGRCYRCDEPTNRMQNCHDLACRTQLVVCEEHAAGTACAEHPLAVVSG